MTIPEFYKVTRVMPKTFEVVELGKRMLKDGSDGYGQKGYEVPVESELVAVRKGKGNVVMGEFGERVYVKEWDGKPIWADYMD